MPSAGIRHALEQRELVIGVGPCGVPNARLAAGVLRGGGVGVVDLGGPGSGRGARLALELAASWASQGFGVRVAARCEVEAEDLDRLAQGRVDLVILGADSAWQVGDATAGGRRRVLCEVTSLTEATAAADAGADGLIARGAESAGRVGELSTFVLLQQLLAQPGLGLPVWASGGVGERTAAAAVIGGAAGVVLDIQFGLLSEAELPEAVTAALRLPDGPETVIVDGYRVLRSGAGGTEAPPIGQDAYLAARFRDRYADTATAVRRIRSAIVEAVTDADAASGILAPGAPLAKTLGVRLPVLQGPMTRVSDQSAFAAAVADGGGLPFLALALAGPEQTRQMMEQTAAGLGDSRPWGVGVLGFAPEQVRTAQLEIIRQLRPPFAIVAGGRPAQARALEDAGIGTFLHVPSPGLLRQFLAAGSRAFVFEGSECGGHTGPRAGFPLWEAQLGVIEDWLDTEQPTAASEMRILLAGGIHDSRSAAMVSAMTRTLAARGVQVGVLMGTAYLFTREAVASGAIQPQFQQVAVEAKATALLESAPGHATRGLVSPFTEEFTRVKRELVAADIPQRDVWEQLEQMNVGRLRIASKGLRREGAELKAVDEAEQLNQGLFMAGQVAVLRESVTTIADLHSEVTEGARDHYLQRSGELQSPRSSSEAEMAKPLDIAIIGMACVFPGSPDLAAYWATILDGTDQVTEVPKERWDPETYYDPTAVGRDAGRATPSKWGGFLPEIPFDPLRYGIPPASLGAIEPTQLLALEVARRALADAGYDNRRPGTDHERTSVVFGAESGSDLANAHTLRAALPAYLGTLPPALAEQLPRLTEDSFPGVLANVIAGRIANRLDLGGANFTVDAACASSLAAIDAGCKELVTGGSDLVLCGGVDLHNGINDFLMFSAVHALSPTGRSRTFDADADGIALGEGAACVVLKRLADAERDGDRIYAVIKGLGSAGDGRALGLTAPRPEGQRRALERAYRQAGLSASRVGLVEAHGTGTVVGDRTELGTLTKVFEAAGAEPGGCALGSVKSQIGHTKCAAGLAGLIKAALSVHLGVRPPTVHLKQPNPGWSGPDASPFVFNAAPMPWARRPAARIAGVSAFGFGGTNFHTVIAGHESSPDRRHGRDQWPAELFVFRSADRAAAHRAIDALLGRIEADAVEAGPVGRYLPWRLRDLALSASRASDARDDRAWVALVAADVADLAVLARRALAGEHDPGAGLFQPQDDADYFADTGTAFLFPGQGSQRPGMLAELFVTFPELQHYLRAGEERDGEPSAAAAMHPPVAFDEQTAAGQEERLRDTRVAQPALGMTGLAVDHLLRKLGVVPDAVAGHSYGELAALAGAGAFDASTLLSASRERARVILEAAGDDPGAMAAVSDNRSEIEDVLAAAGLADSVVAANQNSPKQVVVSGPTPAIEEAVTALRAAGIGAKRIRVACAFHSPVVAAAGESFGEVLAGLPVRAPDVPVYANRTAAPYGTDPAQIRAELAAQIVSPVLFADEIEAMYAVGIRVYVEAGPGKVLTRLVGSILEGRPHAAVAVEDRPNAGLRGLLAALARLAVAGGRRPVRTGWLFEGRDALDAATAPRPIRPGWTVDGHLVRTADGACVPGGLTPARRITLEPTVNPHHAPAADQDALLAEFLRTNREMIAAQRDVMLAYLGGARPTIRAEVVASPAPVLAPVTVAAVEPLPAIEPAPQPPARTGCMLNTVLDVISSRTGYPTDMIEPDLDLEADLSVDSIKRTEIAGELAQRLGFGPADLDDEQMEQLAKARTARAVAEWLESRMAPTAVTDTPQVQEEADVRAPKRLVMQEVECEPSQTMDFSTLKGARFAILAADSAPELAQQIERRLTDLGASVESKQAEADGYIHLGALDPDITTTDHQVLPIGFGEVKAALGHAPRWFVAVRPTETPENGLGLRGLLRTVSREYPATATALLEVDSAASDADTATQVIEELVHNDRHPVILRRDGGRYRVEPVAAELGLLAAAGAGPAGDGAAEAQALGLGREAVAVLIGGARGITARIAAALASAAGCRIELAGRTVRPEEPESAATLSATDPASLRAALIASGMRSPAEVERTTRRILAAREVSATLTRLGELGAASVNYRTLDVRDEAALHQYLKDVHAEHGRIDAVYYAAGVIEDKVIADKDPESFTRVFTTKADGARALLAGLDELPERPRHTVLFGSIAAVFGNRGQSDYAAANDALETLGAQWNARTGARCLTVHWGPWAPSAEHGGMVTPELAQAYAKRGIALIDGEEGALAVLRELAWGDPALTSVVYSASEW